MQERRRGGVMGKWRVTVSFWTKDYEADDEGDALIKADMDFSFMSEARAEEIEDEEEQP
jgi:hypothetical protein